MAWLINNAGTIASLFAIGGYIFGIVKYLRSKMKVPTQPQPTHSSQHQEVSVQIISISLNQWIKIFSQGFVDAADFLLNLVSVLDEAENENPLMRIALCTLVYSGSIVFVGAILAAVIAAVLAIFGMNFLHGFQIGGQIVCVLLFIILSALYVYWVGENIKKIQPEHQQEYLDDMEVTQ